MKKSISFLLILTMILSMLCIVPAVADGDVKQSGDFYYRVKRNGTAVITRYHFPSKSSGELNITVPALIDGYPVTEIGDKAFSDSFYGRDSRKVRIHLPDGITSIGNFAFYNLSVTELNIPDTVEEIGYAILTRGYRSYYSNTTLNISMNHPYYALIDGLLYNKQRKELIASSTCRVESLAIPEGIVSIGDYALAGTHLYRVTFPSTLKVIGDHAFEDCTFDYLGDISFSNVQTVGAYAFYSSSRADGSSPKIVFQSLEEIGEYAFESYSFRPINVDFGDSPITIIRDSAFPSGCYCASIDNINLKSVVTIGSSNGNLGGFFENLSDFPPYLTSIPNELNPSANSLPNTVKRIEFGAYIDSYCSKRTDFYLPTSLEYISEYAFATGSTFIVEPDSYALRWCKENGFGYKINGEKQDLDWLNN